MAVVFVVSPKSTPDGRFGPFDQMFLAPLSLLCFPSLAIMYTRVFPVFVDGIALLSAFACPYHFD